MQVAYLMEGLVARGHEALLVSPQGSGLSQYAGSIGLAVDPVPLGSEFDLSFIPRLYTIIRRFKPDIVHIHSRRGADTMGSVAARLARVPAVILSRRVTNPVRRGLASQLKFGPLCDEIIAVSNGIKNVLMQGGIDQDKVTCVHSVIDAKRYQVTGAESTVRAEFGIGERTNVVTVIGQLIHIKGHRYLFGAAPAILAAFPDTVFLVLGKGRLDSELRKMAASLRIQDRVIFAGFRHDVAEMLSITTVLAHPSLMEGLANCVMQAMAAEVPVVVAAVGGMPEVVRNGINGFLVPAEDSNALAQSVIALLSDPALRSSMGAAGRRIVEEEFCVDRMVAGSLAVYYKALSC